MDIRCERCATEYELDETKIPDAGVTIKCATCQNVFKVSRPASAPAPAAADPSVRIRLYRSGNAQDLSCPDEETLRAWIHEHRVLKTDAITFDGTTWVPLGDVPELADAFPKTPEPKPVERKAPPAPLPPPPPPPRIEKARPTVESSPADATVLDVPRFQVPALATPPKPAAPPPPPAPPAPPPVAARTEPSSDKIESLGKLNRPVEGAPPAFPSLSLPSDPAIVPHKAPAAPPPKAAPPPPPPPPKAAPKPPPPPPSSKPPAAKPVEQQLTQPPKNKSKPLAPPPPAEKRERRPGEGTDYEIQQFKKQGAPMQIIGIVIAVVAVAAGGFAGWRYYSHTHIPDDARAPVEAGRKIYLTDVRSHFQEADDDFDRAIQIAWPAPYADALGGKAELEMAWGEGLLNDAAPAIQEATAKKKAMDAAPTDNSLRSAYNAAAKAAGAVQEEAQKHFKAAMDAAQASLAANDASLGARRANLDYDRIQNDGDNGQKEEKVLLNDIKATDPETKAHVAAFDALSSDQLKVSEQALMDVTKSKPEFIRAWIWLAQIHKRENNVAQAQADLNAVLKAAPGNEEATTALKTLQPPPPTTVVASAPAGPSGPEVDKLVDKLLKDGDKNFEHKKYAKALDDYEKAVSAKPTSVDANLSRALALKEMKRLDDAVDAFQKTLALAPKSGDAMIGLAEAFKDKGEKKDARKFYQAYVDAFPKGENAAAAKANLAALH